VEEVNAKSIFSQATGYIRRGGFEWTCNPYLGCTFGCSYCYAMFLPQNRRPRSEWGRWFQAKQNAVELARRQASRVAGRGVYMSSVTDPYLPAERGLCLTRGILEALLPYQPRLLVQTRGPLVTRDVDLLARFDRVRVNMSIPTDCEEVRRAFEPKAPPLDARWDAIATLQRAGIAVGICITPMLPVRDADSFARRIAATRPTVLVTQYFHNSQGAFGADTGLGARALLAESDWNEARYADCVAKLAKAQPVYEGEAGFFPPA